MDGHAISFGPFRLLTAQRLLLEGDKPVRLGGRAFDILATLAERAGEVVAKDELISRAWPQTFVEESNLKIQISALRRALGDGQGGKRYVVTVPGRGYNFVAPVSREEPSPVPTRPTIAPTPRLHNLPAAVTRMIGREEAVVAIISRLSRQRLVTIVGPGGIGKTTVALAVAEQMTANYQHGVWLIDLAPLSDPRLVPSAVAGVLGLEINAEDLLPGLLANLSDKRMLLLLDTCEHVIDGVVRLAAAVLREAPGVGFVATSREPLGVAGEHQYRLGPLRRPPASSELSADEAAAFPAVQLFVERVSAVVEDFALSDANAPPIGEICRKLDGLPLAIEFAAPRVEVLGVEGVVAHLNDSLPALSARRRTSAIPRHRTMRAVLDWSYGLLSEDEQLFFRALGIFTGGFTVEAAAAVAIDRAEMPCDAIDRLADLVAKSLVVADVSGATPRFRLLDTTRAFALEKLDRSGEREAIAHRHTEYYYRLFTHAAAEAPAWTTIDWLADYAQEVDNLRAALDSAFSPGGEASTGAALTAAAVPLWIHLSLLEECRERARQALGALETTSTEDPREAMRLHAALGGSTPDVSEMVAALTKTLDIAKRLGDIDYQLRALKGLYFYYAGSGQFRAADPFAREFHALALRGSDRTDLMYMMGVAEHYVGDQMSARRHLEQALALDAVADHGRDVSHFQDIVRFGTDLRVSTQVFLARAQWLQGFSNQAVRTSEMSVEEAQATNHALSLCYALALAACPIALWVGNLTAAAHYTGMLIDNSRKHALTRWSAYGSRFQRAVVLMGGDIIAQSQLLGTSLDEVAQSNLSFRSFTSMSHVVEALIHAGRMAEGVAVLQGMEHYETGCYTPELLRLKGELSLLHGTLAAVETAKDLFGRALGEARRQGALSWELRAARSLASLLADQGRSVEAITLLEPVYARFTEGFGTADLIAARQLLSELGCAGRR